MELLKVGAALMCFILLIIVLRRPGESISCRHNRIFSAKEFNGIVTMKQSNTSNHSNERIKLSNGDYFEWEDDRYKGLNLYLNFQKGDSLSKKKGSFDIERFRNGNVSTFNLSLNCDG